MLIGCVTVPSVVTAVHIMHCDRRCYVCQVLVALHTVEALVKGFTQEGLDSGAFLIS